MGNYERWVFLYEFMILRKEKEISKMRDIGKERERERERREK